MTCILIMLDGLGDQSHKCLGNRTPLEAADTPNLDHLAMLGANGLFHAERTGIALPSEMAHFAMFGYGRDEFPGRGVFEALGAGIPLGAGDVAFLAHFVYVSEEEGILVMKEDRPDATAAETSVFIEACREYVTGGRTINFTRTRRLDGIITITGPASRFITDTDPLRAGRPLIEPMPWARAADEPLARATARALKSYLLHCYQKLDAHPLNSVRREKGLPPLNALVSQRAGQLVKPTTFEKRWGLRGLSIASGPMFRGLAEVIGMRACRVEDSGHPGADLVERLLAALRFTPDYDFIHVHTKAPDAAAHTKDPRHKVEVIEDLDRAIGEVKDRLLADEENLIVVTADHSTPSAGPLIHSGEPVPITIFGPGIRRDAVRNFDEINCVSGALGMMRGRDFMPVILNAMGRAKLQGLMDTPEDQGWWPGRRTPFRMDGASGE